MEIGKRWARHASILKLEYFTAMTEEFIV